MPKLPPSKKIKSNTKKILAAAKKTDDGINGMIDLHQQRLSNAISELEKRIVDRVADFQSSNGRLLGPQANLKLAQKVQRDLDDYFKRYYSSAARTVVDGFDEANKYISEELSVWGDAPKFTGVDGDMIKTLKNSAWGTFNSIGDAARETLIDSMYGAIAGRRPFSELLSDFRQALSGEKNARGRSMDVYAKTFANDAIMTYHNEVNMLKSNRLGINHFLYYGNAILTTRPFCRERIGKTFSRDEIESWTFGWQGKSGPAITNRGGYNCRHRWVAVRPTQVDPTELVKGVKPPPPEVKTPPKPKSKKRKAVTSKKKKTLVEAETVLSSPADLKKEYLAAKREFNALTKSTGLRQWQYHKLGFSEEAYTTLYRGYDKEQVDTVLSIFKASEKLNRTKAVWIDSLSVNERVLERKKITNGMIRYGQKPLKGRNRRFKVQKAEKFYQEVSVSQTQLEANVQAGTRHMSTKLLLDLERTGVKIDIMPLNEKQFRAFHSSSRNAIQIAYNEPSQVIAHELGHAIDGMLSVEGRTTGLVWAENGQYDVVSIRNKIRSAYKKVRSGRIGKYKNGDGSYDIGNWIHNYEGRIYTDASTNIDFLDYAKEEAIIGQEFWAMNVQRYHNMVTSARRRYLRAIRFNQSKIQELEREIQKLNANTALTKKERQDIGSALSDEIEEYQSEIRTTNYTDILEQTKKDHSEWSKVRTAYPGVDKAIERLFEEVLT